MSDSSGQGVAPGAAGVPDTSNLPSMERFGGELKRFGREGGGSPSRWCRPSSPPATSPRPSRSSPRACATACATRRFWASPARARRSPWQRPSRPWVAPPSSWRPTRRWRPRLASELREFFPNNTVGVLRQLLRLLPARGVRPADATPTSRRTPRSTRTSRSCAISATASLLSRRDVIVVASVSCIYGIGSPQDYAGHRPQRRQEGAARAATTSSTTSSTSSTTATTTTCTAERSACAATPLDVYPALCRASHPHRVLRRRGGGDPARSTSVTGEVMSTLRRTSPIWPASHYVTERPKVNHALHDHRGRGAGARGGVQGGRQAPGGPAPAAAHRLRPGDAADHGVLHGHRELLAPPRRARAGRAAATRCIDYFPKDMVCIIDESHVTLPQIRGMHEGDRSRKVTLIEHGFRLPSALDNRPLRFDEFEARIPQFVYVSATPGDYEERVSQQVVEQIIRPTGLLDPQDRRAAHPRADRRPHRRVQVPRRAPRAGAGDHAHQAHGREPHRPPAGRGNPLHLHALRHRHHATASRSCASCAPARSTCWWASTCCARAWTSPR